VNVSEALFAAGELGSSPVVDSTPCFPRKRIHRNFAHYSRRSPIIKVLRQFTFVSRILDRSACDLKQIFVQHRFARLLPDF